VDGVVNNQLARSNSFAFAGEAESRLDLLLRDVAAGRLAPVPFLPKRYVARTLDLSTSFDAGRGWAHGCQTSDHTSVAGGAPAALRGGRVFSD
jgi:hypothetical protein